MSSQELPTPNSSISHPFLLPDLPLEIITEILSYLPVKTLIRFRSVSKSWLYLIKNPKFINAHLMKSSNFNNYTHHRLILRQFCILSGQYVYHLNSCSLLSILYPPYDVENIISNDFIYGAELDYSLKDHGRPVSIVGSCNGLVCIVIEKDSIFIWNPSTRESKELPDFGATLGIHKLAMFGFGFDQLNDDYKVVWIVSDETNGVSIEKRVIVYSLRTNSWGQIGDVPRAIPYHKTGRLVNGVLHWKVISPGSFVSPIVIVSFDLGNETYGEIEQPDYGDGECDWSLSVLKGCLCLCCDFDAIHADLWVMKEYGIKDSWIKLCTIVYTTDPENYPFWCDYPLCISVTGEILLLRNRESLVLYDPNYGTFRNHEIIDLSSSLKSLKITNYVESLISPSIYEELWNPQPQS